MKTIDWQLKMTDFEALLISSLAIVVSTLSLLFALLILNRKTPNLLTELLRESNQVNRSLVHLVVSRDFQTYAGLQSLSSQPLSPSQAVTIHSPNSTSDYIPRDDVTEANRLKAFGGQIGYGETIFEDDQSDEELKQAITEMVASGQVDFGEEGFN